MSADTSADRPELALWQRRAMLAGAAGFALALVLAAIPATRAAALRGWLVAFNVCLGLALGSLVILMLQWLVGGGWGFALRRPLEAATRTLPVLAALFLPLVPDLVLPGLLSHDDASGHVSTDYRPALYLWSDPVAVAHDDNLQHKKPYLNVPFALVRTAGYFAVWIALATLLSRWSKQQDASRDAALTGKSAALSAPGLVLYVVTITFYSVDYVMSLEPHWYSTIYGAMFGMSQVLASLAFAIVIGMSLADRPPLDAPFAGQSRRDLGSLLLAFTMVWAYLSLSQFLIIWSGNLPEFVPWYLARIQHGWGWVALALVLFNFALPFVMLLSSDVKRDRKSLGVTAAVVVAMQAVFQVWLTIPSFAHVREKTEPPEQAWLDLVGCAVALAAVGGLWLASYLSQLRAAPLLPLYDPWQEEGAAHGQAAHH